MHLTGFLVVFGCLFVGEVFIHFTKLPLPPSIIGLLLLFTLLSLKWVSLDKLQAVAKTMLDYLAFMIVPACISIMQYLDVIKRDAVPLVLGTLLSTLLVLVVTGKTHVLVRTWLKKRKTNKGGVHGDA